MIIFLANDQGKKVVRKLARLLLFMLVSGFFAKIVDSGLLSKVCLSFVSDKGRVQQTVNTSPMVIRYLEIVVAMSWQSRGSLTLASVRRQPRPF